MKIDMSSLNTDIDAVARKWQTSGHIVLAKSGEVVHKKHYGYADRENKKKTKRNSRYALSLQTPLLLAISTLKLMEQGRMDLKDPVSKYLPELRHGNGIQIEDLLRRHSGLVDYFNSVLMIDLNETPEYQSLSDEEKILAEQTCLNIHRDYPSVIQLINDRDLAFQPGTTGFPPSETELVVLAEILCRITGLSLFDTMKRLVFDSFGMSHVKEGQETDIVSYKAYSGKALVRTPLDYTINHVFTMDAEDATALAAGISKGAGLKHKTWRIATKYDEDNLGLLFVNANGFVFSEIHLLGTMLCLYCNLDAQLAYIVLSNEDQVFENVQGEWQFFRKDLRKAVDSIFTYPVKPKMVKINKDNLWDALGITVGKEQLDFVLEAKSSIAMGLLYKTKRVFVQIEGSKTIGLLVVDVDHRKKFYNIDIIQIDQRFQGRGYGKLMLAFAIDYLKKAGAKELEIGVHRRNKAAQKIYMDAGFTTKSIFEEGMHLHMVLE